MFVHAVPCVQRAPLLSVYLSLFFASLGPRLINNKDSGQILNLFGPLITLSELVLNNLPSGGKNGTTLSGYCEGSVRYCIHVVWHRASSYPINKVVISLQSPTQKHPPLPTPFSSSQTWSLFFLTILLAVGAELATVSECFIHSVLPSLLFVKDEKRLEVRNRVSCSPQYPEHHSCSRIVFLS